MGRALHGIREDQKKILRLFDSFSGKHSRWQIWSDFIILSAIAISNQVDLDHAEEREKAYMSLISKYEGNEPKIFGQLFAEMVKAMDNDPDQDFLGEMYMACNLGNDHAGQFFTPYNICALMAEMNVDIALEKIEEQGYVAVNDPTCGAGALLVAFANACRKRGIDFQNRVLFTAQDIDYVVGCMCYIQLSLMGCAGHVTIGDTLCNPQTYYDTKGLVPRNEENIWYTPMFFSDVWHWRRVWTKADLVVAGLMPQTQESKAEVEAAKELSLEVPAPPEIIKDKKLELLPAYAEAEAGQLTFF